MKNVLSIIFSGIFFCVLPLCAGDAWTSVDRLASVPAADKEGIVIETRTIHASKPHYNPSLVKNGKGFLLASRVDLPGSAWPLPYAMIRCTELDSSFSANEEGVFLELIDNHSEDPRLFYANNTLYMAYVHVVNPMNLDCTIALATIDPQTKKCKHAVDLFFPGRAPREKNWTPLVYHESHGKDSIYFIYTYNPLKVLRLVDAKRGLAEIVCNEDSNPLFREWEQKWGKIRGGTPAIRINEDEYLTFFHSAFSGVNYVMGAILLEAKPPFRVKKISPYPILFQGIYESPPFRSGQMIIFPCGVVESIENERHVLHVSCGENDTAVKVVTFDKQALLRSLRGNP